MKKNLPAKKPPDKSIKSPQMELFGKFITNNSEQVSNSIEVWESIPKYFFTPRQMEKLRTPEGLANSFTWKYEHQGVSCLVKFQPALIGQPDGTEKAFFPGITEELVEEALKKILSKQQYAIHDQKNSETWVRFTLHMIQKDLKSKGKMRSLDEIKHAIEIMSSCVITWGFDDGMEIWKGAILQDLVTVGRKEYLADKDSHHVARLPVFISTAIKELDYRQFNYDRLMGCKEQVARMIYKLLINHFKQASWTNDYHFMYSTLKNSGLLQQGREIDNRRKVISALKELQKREVLEVFKSEDKKFEGKINNVKYTISASREFVKEQKAANKRQTEIWLKNK